MAGEKYLQVGDKAPEFTLPKANGELVSLSDFRGRAEVVLFFYPKDNSPVCTAEACSFRDSYEVFRDAGAEVIGISTDSSPIARAVRRAVSPALRAPERQRRSGPASVTE